MKNWFECKICYDKLDGNGLPKKERETYLVQAYAFADAEENFIEEMKPYISGEFSVSAVRKKNIGEIVAASGDKWYDCKIFFSTETETGVRKIKQTFIVQGSCIENALKSAQEALKGTMADYDIVSISETPIMDIFAYAVN